MATGAMMTGPPVELDSPGQNARVYADSVMGLIREPLTVYPTRFPADFCSSDGTLIFDRVLRYYWDLYARDQESGLCDAFDGCWLAYLDACGAAPPTYSSARVYYELFNGLACDDRITDLTMRMMVGGTEAYYEGRRYRVSVYGRAHINGRNLVTLHRDYIDQPDRSIDPNHSYIVSLVAAVEAPGGMGLSIAHQPDFPRNVTISCDAAQTESIHFYGTDDAGEYQSEELTFTGVGGGETVAGTAIWKHISGLHQDQASGPAEISVGIGSSLGAAAFWHSVNIDEDHIDAHAVRCAVLKVEALLTDTYTKQNTEYVPGYADQASMADPPPWGVRVKSASVYASPLRRNVTVPGVVRDIAHPWWAGDHFFCPDEAEGADVEVDQLVFEDIPKTRLDALLEVDQLLDWDIEATKDTFTYRKPVTLGEARDDELYRVSLSDPHYAGSITPAVDECWNGVRTDYSNKNERPKEIVLWGTSEWLGDRVKSHVVTLPESIRSKKQAERVSALVLASGLEPPIAGAPVITKTIPVASGEDRDCLLIRPGELLQVTDVPRTFSRTEREISAVSLHPMVHTADVELGPKSRKLEKWLARYAAKGKT